MFTDDDDFVIYGNDFNQDVYALGGDDVVVTGSNSDRLSGGAGNDYLNGGAGSDIYFFGRGDGQDEIEDLGNYYSDSDSIHFTGGLT